MTIDYLVQQVDGTSRFTLQDGSGFLLLQSSTAVIFDREDVVVVVHSTGDIDTFVRTSQDSKIYLNSTRDIDVLT
jgi:hypothetical protein